MSVPHDTVFVCLASQPIHVQAPAESFWQSNFAAGVVGSLIGGALTLVGAALSPLCTDWLTVRRTSQRVARRVRADLIDMRIAIRAVASRLNPETGMLAQFGPGMLNDLADRLGRRLAAFRERATTVFDLHDETVEHELLTTIESIASFENQLKSWASPLPKPGEDIRIINYSAENAQRVRQSCEVRCIAIDQILPKVAAIERWRWKLPKLTPPQP